MGHIFISYSRKDEEYVNNLVDALENEGFEVWIDRELLTGDTWTQVVNHKIDTCDAFVIVMTDESKKSNWVRREVLYAIQEGKKIFPLLLQGKLWMLLQDFNYFKVTDGLIPNRKFFKDIEKSVKQSETWLKTQREATEKAAREKARLEEEESEKEKKDLESAERERKEEELREKRARKISDRPIPIKPKTGSQITYWVGGFIILVSGIVFLSSLNNPVSTPQPTTEEPQLQIFFTATHTNTIETIVPSQTVSPELVSTEITKPKDLFDLEEISFDNLDSLSEMNSWKLNNEVYGFSWMPDGRSFATWGDGDVSYFVLGGGVETLPNTKDIWAIGFSEEGKLIGVNWVGEKTINLYNDLLLNTAPQALVGHTQEINTLIASADNELLVSGSSDNTVRVWRISDGTLLRTFIGHESDVGSLAISPDNNIVASSSEDCTIRLWDIPNDKLLSTIKLQDCVSRPVAFSPDGNILASYTRALWLGKQTVGLWKVDDGTLIKSLECPKSFNGSSEFQFSPNGQLLEISNCYTESTGGTLWRVFDDVEPIILSGLWLGRYQYFSSDSKILMGGMGPLYFYDTENGDLLHSMEIPNSLSTSLTGLMLSPNGRVLLSADTDGSIYLWGIPKQ